MANQDGDLSLDDFLLDKASQDEVTMTKDQQRWLKSYENKFPNAKVVDLTQNPEFRPRKGVDVMPTLTTSCARMYHIRTGQYFTGLELAMLHGLPVTGRAAGKLRVRTFHSEGCSNACLCGRVGNSMHMASIGLVMAAGVVLTHSQH